VVGRSEAQQLEVQQQELTISCEMLLQKSEPERQTLIEAYLQRFIARLIKIAPAQLDKTEPLTQFGIDSILAVECQHQVESQLNIQFPVSKLLDGISIAELASEIRQQLQNPQVCLKPLINHRAVTQYPLSYNQQALWFLYKLAPDSPAYNIFFATHIHSPLEVEVAKKIIDILVQRHPALRTTYGLKQGQALQQVHSELPYEFKVLDTSYWSQKQVKQYLMEEGHKPFNLETGPLLRIQLLKRLKDKHILFWNIHHIITDMWSMMVLLDEFSQLYIQHLRKLPFNLPEMPTATYTDYVHWQTEMLASELGRDLWVYWRDKLSGDLPHLELPTDHPRPPIQQFAGARHLFQLDWNLTEQLKQLAQNNHTTLYTVLLAVFQVLLHRYTGQNDIIVGSVMAGRTHTAFNKLFGYLVNPVALRANCTDNPPFQTFLMQMRQTVLEALEHQAYPFQLLIKKLQPERDASRSPLFSVLFGLQQPPKLPEAAPFVLREAGAKMQMGGLELESIHIPQQVAQFDMTLLMAESKAGLAGAWEYNTALFEPETIERMVGHFTTLLQSIVENINQPIGALPLLTKVEQHQFTLWNDRTADYALDKTVTQLFEQQAATYPDHIAVTDGQVTYTYTQLNQRANQLAQYLKAQGVTRNTLVGVFMERSAEAILALVAIIKAGGAYLPIDLNYPQDRIGFMLTDSQVTPLITQSTHQAKLPDTHPATVICLDTLAPALAEYPVENLASNNTPEDVIYVIYTSGSTGKPKGVEICHQSVNHLLINTNYLNIEAQDCVAQATNLSFDPAVFEIWGALLAGAKLAVLPRSVLLDSETLGEKLSQYAINILVLITPLFNHLAQVNPTLFKHLKCLVVGGDVIDITAVRAVLEQGKPQHLLNAYGPTENTVISSCYDIQQVAENQLSIPIGKAIADSQTYVLDSHHQQLPVGVAGELYVGGAGLAKGYLNQPALTQERFVEVKGIGRLYKTGDWVQCLANGDIEYLGRMDNQVKVRGFRIELGEIESTLTSHALVDAAVVKVRLHNNTQQLVAYVTTLTDSDPALTEKTALFATLKHYLAEHLPEYMLPAIFVKLEHFPLTPNNKIDRNALPEPEAEAVTKRLYIAPHSDEERYLVEVWEAVLKRHPISINDNFFELGGDSILSIQVVTKARKLGLGLNAHDIFEHQTIAELAAYAQHVNVIEAEQGILTGHVALTPIQRYFFSLPTTNPNHFNQALLLKVPTELPERIFQTALGALLSHHDGLRLRFERTTDTWRQYYSDPSDTLPFHTEDLREFLKSDQMTLLQQRAERYQRSLDLSQGSLTRLVLFRLSKQNYLFWTIHHLVVDGISWRILLEDLQTACHQLAQDKPVQLPLKTTAYQYWASRLLDYSPNMPVAYWQQLAPHAALPTDRPQGSNCYKDVEYYSFELDAATTTALLTKTTQAYNTQINDLLLVALLQTLQHWTQQTDWVIDLESHGRADIFDDIDISRTVGWFTSLYSVALHLAVDSDLPTTLKSVKEQLRKIAHEGIDYGIWKYLKQQALPSGQLVFNYLGQFNFTEDNNFVLVDMLTQHNIHPDMPRSYPFEINSYVNAGQLKFIWGYSREQYTLATLERLGTTYQQYLTALITHCQQQDSLGYTPSDFPLARLSQAAVDIVTAPYGGNLLNLYPLSPAQQTMLQASQQHPQRGAYIVQFHCYFKGDLAVERLQQAWQLLINRHEILRTAFVLEANPPLQVVYKQATLPWQTLDWQDLTADAQAQRFTEYLAQQRQQGFQLDQAPLTQCTLIQLAPDTYRFIWTSHHALLDGWCLSILFKELMRLYRQGEQAFLPHPEPYHDYIAWLHHQDVQSALDYWQDRLQSFTQATPLPLGSLTPDAATHQQLRCSVTEELTQQLHQFAQHHQLTLNSLMQCAWGMLLSHYSQQSDIVFGVTNSGRHIDLFGIHSRIGLFINTLPLRLQIDDTPLVTWLQNLQIQQQADINYCYMPFAQIQACSPLDKQHRLFESVLVFENYPLDTHFAEAEAFTIENPDIVDYNHYPLTLFVIPHEHLYLQLAYDTGYFEATAIQTLLDTLQTLLASLVTQPDIPVSQLLADLTQRSRQCT